MAAPSTQELVDYVNLLRGWTRRNLETRYSRSLLRLLWTLLNPIIFVVIYVVIFGVIFKQTGGSVPYLSYLISGYIIYRAVQNALNANSCIVDNLDLIEHAKFSREIIPLSQVTVVAIDLLVTFTAYLLVAGIQGHPPTEKIFAAPLVLLSTLIFSAAVCITASVIQVFVRDFQFAANLVGMAMFFTSPVSYLPESLPHWLNWLNWSNPISVNISALRALTLQDQWPDWSLFGVHFVITSLALVLAVWHLHAVEYRIVDLG
ncbi:MAG: ABC transporter permease [Microthrixaceae bacterium]